MEKLNIAELLKDCPTGMELDCTFFEGLEFDCIVDNEYLPIRCRIKHPNGGYTVYNFTKYGCWLDTTFAKCVIFPKGKTTWKGFQRPFKDGDIVTDIEGEVIIYKGIKTCGYCGSFVSLDRYNQLIPHYESYLTDCIRFATKEEKQKLFDAIKANGYKWNPKTKTLEKLPEFKAGDVLVSRAGNIVLCSHIDDNQVIHYHCILLPPDNFIIKNDVGVGKSFHCTLATDAEKQRLFDKLKSKGYKYNPQTNKLEKFIVPKFKVGDRIKHRLTGDVYKILFVISNGLGGGVYDVAITNEIGKSIDIKEQDNYELVPNKFDITTLKAFESKVLVRSSMDGLWKPAVFGFRNGYNDNAFYIVGGSCWKQCIPYLNNEHLCGTTNDCEEYFKTWE